MNALCIKLDWSIGETTYNMYASWAEKYYNEYRDKFDCDVVRDKLRHISNCVQIADMVSGKKSLLSLCMLYHDIGRMKQYEVLGSFNDNVIDHKVLGEQIIVSAINKGELDSHLISSYLRASALWHGITNRALIFDNDVKTVVTQVTDIDALENGCLSTRYYLEREIMTDAKGYVEHSPELDQTQVRGLYLASWKSGNRMKKDCITYAEYLLFASHLLMQSKQKYPEIMNALFKIGHIDMVGFYVDLFRKYIDKRISDGVIDFFIKYMR